MSEVIELLEEACKPQTEEAEMGGEDEAEDWTTEQLVQEAEQEIAEINEVIESLYKEKLVWESKLRLYKQFDA